MKVALHGRRLRLLLAAAVLALACAAVAAASTFTAGALVRTPDMPLAGTSAACAARVAASTAAGSVNYPDAEVEPYVTVDPTNPNHLVAMFQQDRWNDGGANGDVVVVSNDGGASWHLASVQPKFTICQGATTGLAGLPRQHDRSRGSASRPTGRSSTRSPTPSTRTVPPSAVPARSSSAARSTAARRGRRR